MLMLKFSFLDIIQRSPDLEMVVEQMVVAAKVLAK